jgi:hypothetical protein
LATFLAIFSPKTHLVALRQPLNLHHNIHKQSTTKVHKSLADKAICTYVCMYVQLHLFQTDRQKCNKKSEQATFVYKSCVFRRDSNPRSVFIKIIKAFNRDSGEPNYFKLIQHSFMSGVDQNKLCMHVCKRQLVKGHVNTVQ